MATKTTRAKKEPTASGSGVVVAPMNLKASTDAPKPGGPPPAGPYKGIYLDDESREKLRVLEQETGESASAVIRKLIKNADGLKMARLAVLADEMKSLL